MVQVALFREPGDLELSQGPVRPPRVKEGGSDTAKRCFRGPHELAFIRSKIFIYPQFASSAVEEWSALAMNAEYYYEKYN